MGEIADSLIEDGMLEWEQHRSGLCDDSCTYCLQEFLKDEEKSGRQGKRNSRRSKVSKRKIASC